MVYLNTTFFIFSMRVISLTYDKYHRQIISSEISIINESKHCFVYTCSYF